MYIINEATRFLFFTGKGGVGKTSTACATAIALADNGRRVLLVSTDPASNLNDVLGGIEVKSQITAVENVPGLFALNINPETAAHNYRERVVAPYRGVLPDKSIAGLEEQLSGACTVEVAAFDEFSALISDAAFADFDHIVFDTAPTGHTLRLLALPAAWTDFLNTNERGASCLGPISGLKMQQTRYASTVEALADSSRTTLVLVIRPELMAIKEAERTSSELESVGFHNQVLIINGIFHATLRTDSVAIALEERGEQALAQMPVKLRSLHKIEVPLHSHNIIGVNALRNLFYPSAKKISVAETKKINETQVDFPSLSTLIDEIAANDHGLVMVMGKGGVGKTTIAAAIATELASRGLSVHLTTTDPAAHITATLEKEIPGLRVSRIDPKVETQTYKQQIIDRSKNKLDKERLALLEEDLKSPCTEEVAVFHAFSRIVAQAKKEIVIMDTAPTGHTLLLLDATGSYHREVMRTVSSFAKNIITPLMRLRDKNYTKVLLVALPETTPINEAAQLQSDLRRANIEPFAWIINSCLAATKTKDPVLVKRAQAEIEEIAKVQENFASRVVIVPWSVDVPVGAERLRQLANAKVPGLEKVLHKQNVVK
jgi:arsenite-transporting ATPase